MKTIPFFFILLSILAASSHASFDGLDLKELEESKIAAYSRPCCSFANSFFQHRIGLAGLYMGIDKMGKHNYLRTAKKDKVGLTYTCSAGFLDISHLRDTADWTAHIYYNLKKWIGSGQNVEVRNENAFYERSVLFKEVSPDMLSTLNEEDLQKLAISLAFNLAILHEIPSTFNIQSGSAFSVEDAYSNLLGAHIGIAAAVDSKPYNTAMTVELDQWLQTLGGLTKKETKSVHKSVRRSWWKMTFFGGFRSVMKRDFTHEGRMYPFLVETELCEFNSVHMLSVPDKLSNGLSVNAYYELRGVMKDKLQRKLQKLGVSISNVITQKDFTEILSAIRAKFLRSFGLAMDHNPLVTN